jgi:hypothetical protein
LAASEETGALGVLHLKPPPRRRGKVKSKSTTISSAERSEVGCAGAVGISEKLKAFSE